MKRNKSEKMNNDEITNERLNDLEKKMEYRKRNGNRLCWITYNPAADFDYDVEDAIEDVRWMVFEIKRLQEENRHYKEFISILKDQMITELDIDNSGATRS